MKRCTECMESFPDELNVCPNCGSVYKIPAHESDFNHSAGTNTMKICTQCGARNEKASMFCEQCGNKLTDNFNGFEEFGTGFNQNTVYAGQNKAQTNIAKKPWFIAVIIIASVIFLLAIFNILIFTNAVNVESVPALKNYQNFVYSKIFHQNEQEFFPVDETTTYIEKEEPTTQKETTTDQSTTENSDNGNTVADEKSKYIVDVGKGNVLNLRSEKSTSSKILAEIENNTKLVITKIENGWGYTKYSGKTGWVSMKYVLTEDEAKTTTTKSSQKGDFNFATTDLYGNPVSYSDFADASLILVNFWEPYCNPCIDEMPDLEELYEEYKDDGLVIIGVYYALSQGVDAKYIVDDIGITYPIIQGNNDLRRYTTDWVPTTILVDKNGNVITSNPYIGAKSYSSWEKIITDNLYK